MSETSNPKVGNFQVGDLVTLSTYGRSTDQNSQLRQVEEEAGTQLLGLVHKIAHGRYPIHVKWVGHEAHSDWKGTRNLIDRFFFRELKKLNK